MRLSSLGFYLINILVISFPLHSAASSDTDGPCAKLNRFSCSNSPDACCACFVGYVPNGISCVLDVSLERSEMEADIRDLLEIERFLEVEDKTAEMRHVVNKLKSEISNQQVHRAQAQRTNLRGEQAETSSVLSPLTLGLIIGGCVALFVGVIIITVLVYRHKKQELSRTEFEAREQGDRKLAHSAQMYHYQHQRQQMMMMQRADENSTGSDNESVSTENGEEPDYTVYECAGLAKDGEMQVENPLFDDSDLPTDGEPDRPNEPPNNHLALHNGHSSDH